jgi:glutaredoxin
MSGGAVEVLCRAGCGKCAGVTRWLTRLGHSFVVHDVTADPSAARRLAELGFSTLPVVLTADGRAAAGSNPAALSAALPLLAADPTGFAEEESR